MQKRKIKIILSLFIILICGSLIAFISKKVNIPNTNDLYDNYLEVNDHINLKLNNIGTTMIVILSIIITAVLIYLILTKFGQQNLFVFKEHIIVYLTAVILCSSIFSILNIGIINTIYIKNKSKENLQVIAKNYIKNTKKSYQNETLEENSIAKSVLFLENSKIELNNIIINKSKDTNSKVLSLNDGLNSAIVALNSQVKIKNTVLTTDGLSSFGVFAKNKETNVEIIDSKIQTLKDNSYGIILRSDANAKLQNSEIITNLRESHGILVNKGKIEINDSKINTLNEDSYAVYVKGEAIINKSVILSEKSNALVVENSGKIYIDNTKITTYRINIFRANEITSDLSAILTINGGEIDSKNSLLFNISNNKAVINLSNVIIKPIETLLKITKDESKIENLTGGSVELNSNNQKLDGEILVDSLSSLIINLKNISILNTSLNKDNLAKKITLNISKDSKLILKNDAYIHTFINKLENLSNIEDNGYNIYYDKNNGDNVYLNGQTYKLKSGGNLTPM